MLTPTGLIGLGYGFGVEQFVKNAPHQRHQHFIGMVDSCVCTMQVWHEMKNEYKITFACISFNVIYVGSTGPTLKLKFLSPYL